MPETTRTVTRRPPLPDAEHGPQGQSGNAPIAIELLAPRARFALRLDPALLPRASTVAGFPLDLPVNRCAVTGGRRSLRLGPDEWLLWCQPKEESHIAREVETSLHGLHHALIDIGHAQVALSVAGNRAANVINAGCPLDLHDTVFPAGTATRTLLGKAEIILSRWDDRPAFEVECGRSFAAYVREFLAQAARQYLGEV